MKIGVLVADGVFDVGLAALLDTLGVANQLSASPLFEVARVGMSPQVTTSQGLVLTVDGLATTSATAPDVVLVPALGCITPDTLDAALGRPDVVALSRMVAAWRGRAPT